MINLILKVANGTRSAVAVAAFGIGGTMLFRLSPYADVKALLNGANLPEETITSPDRLAEILDALGAAGRELYLQFQVWDLINPILIGVAGVMLLGWLLKRDERANSTWRFVVLLPVALLASDLLENLLIAIAVGAFPDRTIIGNALPFATAAKFGAAVSTLLAVLALALKWLRDRLFGVTTQKMTGI